MASYFAIVTGLILGGFLGLFLGKKIGKRLGGLGLLIFIVIGLIIGYTVFAGFITSWMAGSINPFDREQSCEPDPDTTQLSWDGCGGDTPYCSQQNRICQSYEKCVIGGEPSIIDVPVRVCFRGV